MPIKFAARLIACFVLASFCSAFTTAQQTTPPPSPDPSAQSQTQTPAPGTGQPVTPAQPATADKDKDKDDKNKDKNGQGQSTSSAGTNTAAPAGEASQRLGFALPNFLTVQNGAKLPPLSAKDKFKVVARGSFDPVNFAWYGLLAGINQADNAEPQYGQGWASYGKRYGTTWADGVIENFMVGAVFPSMFRQDPRFYRAGDGGFGHRFGYSASRIFITRGDSGKRQFNFSEVIGSAVSASISTFTYHPKSTYLSTPTNPHMFVPSDRVLSNAATVWVTQMGTDAATLVIKEFWPDVARKLKHKKAAAAPGQ